MADKPLLVIELDDIDAVPKVLYKGKEIEKKVHVIFKWETNTDTPTYGCPLIDIEYLANESKGKPYTETIGYNRYFNAGDE